MPHIFEITHKSILGRIGKLETPHGIVETPALMPVVNPNIQIIPPSELRRFGAEIIITNSYIIYRNPLLRERALREGIHSLLGFNGTIMTDSGSYQLSLYGNIDVENLEIVKFQQEIGSDIGVPLDIPTPPHASRKKAEAELEVTIQRAKQALASKKDMLITAPVQGSTYTELRQQAAKILSKEDFDIYAIGGVVPLLENYSFTHLVEIIMASKKNLIPSAPVHLFGAGHPMMFSFAVALGCDLFDSASYALYAKQGRYMTYRGTYHVDSLHYLPCSCPVCISHTPKEIKEGEELLALHNLYVSFAEIRVVKQAIKEGNLWELVEQRCRAHPQLLNALKQMLQHSEWIEKFQPITRSTFFYLGTESALRPEVLRYRNKLKNLSLNGKVLIRTQKLRDEDEYDWVLEFKPPFGAYPVELSETYPFNAETIPYIDYEALTIALQNLLALIQMNPECEFTFVYNTEHPLMKEISKRIRVVRYE